jgi:hypothetical protein
MPTDFRATPARTHTGLVDVLDRVLDKGLIVAGDIRVSLAEVELLTIRIRLMICSIDKAEAIGLDWWKHDRYLTAAPPVPGPEAVVEENQRLRQALAAAERRLAAAARRPVRARPRRARRD